MIMLYEFMLWLWLCYCYGSCTNRERGSIMAAVPTGREALLRPLLPTGRGSITAAVPARREDRCLQFLRLSILSSSSGLLARLVYPGFTNTEQEDNQRCEQDQQYNGHSQKDEQQYADKSTNMIGDLNSFFSGTGRTHYI